MLCPQDLASFELMECNLLAGVPGSVAALLPPSLQTLRLRYDARFINPDHLFAVRALNQEAAPQATEQPRRTGSDSRPCARQCKCKVRTAIAHVPHNLKWAWACGRQGHNGMSEGLGSVVTSLLSSLPLLRAPLRHLSLQRGRKTPVEGAMQSVPSTTDSDGALAIWLDCTFAPISSI